MMSTSADQPSAPTSRVGAELRAARDRIGWGLPDVAAGLRIRLPYLEAIEAGRLSDLPGNAYALGFVRSYAQALGLDPDEIARRFRAEAAEVNRRTELDFPAPVPERGMPAGAMILLGVLLTVGAYVAWYRSSDRQPNAEPVRAVPERLAPLAETAPPPATPAPAPARAPPRCLTYAVGAMTVLCAATVVPEAVRTTARTWRGSPPNTDTTFPAKGSAVAGSATLERSQ